MALGARRVDRLEALADRIGAAACPVQMDVAREADIIAGYDTSNFDAIIDDAINRRMPLGHGGLPLGQMVDALPAHLPMAVEERSVALRDAFHDLAERARQCARTSRAWLEERA